MLRGGQWFACWGHGPGPGRIQFRFPVPSRPSLFKILNIPKLRHNPAISRSNNSGVFSFKIGSLHLYPSIGGRRMEPRYCYCVCVRKMQVTLSIYLHYLGVCLYLVTWCMWSASCLRPPLTRSFLWLQLVSFRQHVLQQGERSQIGLGTKGK